MKALLTLLKQPQHMDKLVIVMAVAYFLIFGALSVLKHESFHSTAFDLGIFDQTVWMFSQGQNSINTINGFYPFADHIQPILFLPALLYKIFPTPLLLLLLQAAAISLGAIPIYLLARKKLNEKLAVAFVLAYMLYPPTQYLMFFDFHAEAFMITFLLFAVYFLLQKSYRWMFLFLLLSGLTKEYIPVIFVFFAAYVLIFQKKPKIAAVAAAIGIAWLMVNYKIILSSYEFNSLYIYVSAYGGETTVMGKITTAIAGLFTIDKIGYVFLLLLPLAGLSLLAPELLLLSVPGFAIALLKANTTYYSIVYQYQAFIAPFLFAAAIIGLQRAFRILRMPMFSIDKKKIATVALVALGLLSLAAYGPFTTLYKLPAFNAWSTHAKAGHELIELIPKDTDVVVSSTTWAAPHLSQRNRIYMFPAPFFYNGKLPEKQMAQWFNSVPEYVVLDTSRKDIMLDDELIATQGCNAAKSGNYTIAYDKDGWVLLQSTSRGADPVPRLCT